MNFEINPNFWINCMECLQENKSIPLEEKRYLGIGVEISDKYHCYGIRHDGSCYQQEIEPV